MSTRKSPDNPASETPLGIIKTGNDGNEWIVLPVKNDVHRWFLLGSKKEINTYYVHSNRVRPYKVVISQKYIIIYKSIYDKKDDNYNYEYLINFNDYKEVFIPTSNTYECKGCKGNTILVYLGDYTYIYIERYIQLFKLKEEIIEYKSPIGNNDFPYAYGISKNNYYYFSDLQIYIPIDFIKNNLKILENTSYIDEPEIYPYSVLYKYYDTIPTRNKKMTKKQLLELKNEFISLQKTNKLVFKSLF